MKKLFTFGLAVILINLVAACTSTTPPSPTSIVQSYYAAINGKKLDEALNYLHNDILLTTPNGKTQGKDAVSKYLAQMLKDDFKSENSNYREKNGEVRYDYIVYFGGSEVDRNTNGLTIVKDGKIIFDGLDGDQPK